MRNLLILVILAMLLAQNVIGGVEDMRSEELADKIEDLWQKVTILRDTYGVPHIYGDDGESVYFGFGYAQAEDHLLRMLRMYIFAMGEAAATFGAEHFQSDLNNADTYRPGV